MSKRKGAKKKPSAKAIPESGRAHGTSGGTIAKTYRDSLGGPARDMKYNMEKDPPEQVMELIRGDPVQLERYAHYMKLLKDDTDLDLNMLECHRLSVIFVNLDRFKNWELSKGREEWVTFLKENYSVADLMRKYEQYALDYLHKHKLADRGPSSVFDRAKSIMAEFRGGGGEIKIEWHGEQELVMEDSVIDGDYEVETENGDINDENYQREEASGGVGLASGSDVPQYQGDDKVTSEDGSCDKHRRRDTEGDD